MMKSPNKGETKLLCAQLYLLMQWAMVPQLFSIRIQLLQQPSFHGQCTKQSQGRQKEQRRHTARMAASQVNSCRA